MVWPAFSGGGLCGLSAEISDLGRHLTGSEEARVVRVDEAAEGWGFACHGDELSE